MQIKEEEVMEAIIELEYKSKAHSCDNMLDKIFKKQTYLRILLNGKKIEEEELAKKKEFLVNKINREEIITETN